jgi:ATP-dependent protease HslVU (ClpYQ) peptidase subunit
MSVLVAIKKNDKIYLGADTQATRGGVKTNFLGEDGRKIKLLDNGIIVGAVGPKKGCKLIFAHPEFFTLNEDGELTKKHVALNVVPLINKCLEENNMVTFEKGEPPAWENVFFIAHRDKLFWIPKSEIVVAVNHYVSAGAGDDVAFPGLMKLDSEDVTDDGEIYERLVEILKVTEDRISSVSGPFFLIDTESKEFKMIKE